MDKKLSLQKIIIIDYTAFVAFLFPVVTWVIYFFLLGVKQIEISDLGFPTIASVITIAALMVLVWRVRHFFTIFNDGVEASATISNVSFFRDRGRVDYIFTYQGQKHAAGNVVNKVKQTVSLRVGDQVTVMLDRNNPQRAYLRDLYI